MNNHLSFDSLYRAKQQLETIFDHLQEGIVLLDRDLRILRVNKTFAQWVGQKAETLTGKTCFQGLWTLPRVCTICPAKEVFSDGKPVTDIEQSLEISGRKTFWSISCYPVLNNGKVEMIIEHYKDVTEEKRFFEMQIRTEKLISLGMMVAGVAHEVMNPLSGISGIANNMLMMPERYGLNETGQKRIQTMLDSVTRAQAILSDLLNLSCSKQYIIKRVEIRGLLEKVMNSIHLKGFDKIETLLDIEDEDIPEIWCDPEKISVVLVNLLQNAAHSVNKKIEQKAQEGADFQGKITMALRKIGEKILISVIDNGMGIKKERLKTIFDPFYTTKGPGKGTGLGLSISNRIVIEHKGAIFVDSSPKKTVFTVELPTTIPPEDQSH